MLWHAKYEAWIPNHPEHALVYMADEKHHGLGFPGAIYQRRPQSPNDNENELPTEELSVQSRETAPARTMTYAESLRDKNLVKIADGVDEHVASVLDELRAKWSR